MPSILAKIQSFLKFDTFLIPVLFLNECCTISPVNASGKGCFFEKKAKRIEKDVKKGDEEIRSKTYVYVSLNWNLKFRFVCVIISSFCLLHCYFCFCTSALLNTFPFVSSGSTTNVGLALLG